jgi:hypothetical protein
MGRSAVSLYPAESSRGPSPLWTMRGAKPSPFLALPQPRVETETGGLIADTAAMLAVSVIYPTYSAASSFCPCPAIAEQGQRRKSNFVLRNIFSMLTDKTDRSTFVSFVSSSPGRILGEHDLQTL